MSRTALALALLHGDARAVREPREAGGDHLLLGLHAVRDHGARIVLLRDRDRPHRDLVLGFDHVNERPLRPALHGGGRHDHDLFQRIDQHADVDELPRPELQVGVGKFRLDADRSRRLIHLVVDHPQGALIDRGAVVAASASTRSGPFAKALLTCWNCCCGRLNSTEIGWTCVITTRPLGVVRLHQIAFVDHAHAGAAGDRRDDLGVAQHGHCVVDRRLIALHLRFELRDQRLLRIGLLLRAGVHRGEARVAFQIDARIGERRLVLRLLGDGLVVLRLIGARIDLGEHEALLDVLAFLEGDLDDLPADLRRAP